MPARSARALAFDVSAPSGAFASFGAVEDPEEDEDAAREMREAESRDEGAEEPKEPEPRADDRAEENDDDETIGERIPGQAPEDAVEGRRRVERSRAGYPH